MGGFVCYLPAVGIKTNRERERGKKRVSSWCRFLSFCVCGCSLCVPCCLLGHMWTPVENYVFLGFFFCNTIHTSPLMFRAVGFRPHKKTKKKKNNNFFFFFLVVVFGESFGYQRLSNNWKFDNIIILISFSLVKPVFFFSPFLLFSHSWISFVIIVENNNSKKKTKQKQKKKVFDVLVFYVFFRLLLFSVAVDYVYQQLHTSFDYPFFWVVRESPAFDLVHFLFICLVQENILFVSVSCISHVELRAGVTLLSSCQTIATFSPLSLYFPSLNP